MQRTWVWTLVQEDPTCRGATTPVHHNYWAYALERASHNYWANALEPVSHNYWVYALEPASHNYWACALEPTSHNYWARSPRARALQWEKPPQWEARAPQQRVPLLTATSGSPRAAMKTQCSQK